MASQYDSMDLEELRYALRQQEQSLRHSEANYRGDSERIKQIRDAMATKIPDHGGVFGRLPGKVVREARLIPVNLGEDFPAMLQVTFTDESTLAAYVSGRVEVWDEPLRETRSAIPALELGVMAEALR
jgi:hypothetical protein